jgi:hypothetical protein
VIPEQRHQKFGVRLDEGAPHRALEEPFVGVQAQRRRETGPDLDQAFRPQPSQHRVQQRAVGVGVRRILEPVAQARQWFRRKRHRRVEPCEVLQQGKLRLLIELDTQKQ